MTTGKTEAYLVTQTVENPPANAGDPVLTPELGRPPGAGNGYPLQYSCLANSMDRGAWRATDPSGCRESDMTEQLALFHWKKT